MYYTKILADSIAFGVRLVTMEVCFPRFILAEVNTHRLFSRNSASSRAIPVERRIKQVRENPFVPEAFAKNQKGMSADYTLADVEAAKARSVWNKAAGWAADKAEELAALGVHKQHANRLLEPFCWHTAVISSTEWANFFALRTHKAAQPEMQIIAKMMLDEFNGSDPVPLAVGEWHLPYVNYIRFDEHGEPWDHPERKLPIEQQLQLSVVRCAAVSYERQDAERTMEQVAQRHNEMRKMAHWSPFEHQAQVLDLHEYKRDAFIGNFRAPWFQYRKQFAGEDVFTGDAE